MDDTVRQLGELALGAIPTIVLFVVIWILYRLLVHNPLGRALAERRSRTVGAVEKAKSDIAAAEEKTSEYERKIGEARIAVFKTQEKFRQKILEERTIALAEARAAAETLVTTKRKEIEKEAESARSRVQAESSNLAAEIIRMILRTSPARQQVGGRG
jgi:F-type H+-transporting ATPase subunit b